MPRLSFLMILVSAQILLIFLLIHKSSCFIKESYEQQKLTLMKNELQQKKEQLINQLCTYKNPKEIKKIAQETLKMRPLTIKQVKNLPLPPEQSAKNPYNDTESQNAANKQVRL